VKKHAFAAIAERMYVAQEYSFEAIATELKLSDKTVRTWAQDGNWQGKKAALLKQKTALHEDLYAFTRKLVKLISTDMDRLSESAGSNPETDSRLESRINSLSRLLAKLPTARGYEETVEAAKKAEEVGKQGASSDEIEKRVNELLGL